MGSVNKVILVGNLGADPELKYTPSGTAVCNLRIATTETYKDKAGQKQEKTEWHRITIWAQQGENAAKYLAKGRSVYIEGRLETRSYDKDGQKHYATDIIANQVVFLGGGNGNGDGAGAGGEAKRGSQRETSSRPATRASSSGGGWGDSTSLPPPDDDVPF